MISFLLSSEKEKNMRGKALGRTIELAKKMFGTDPCLAANLADLAGRHHAKWCQDQEQASLDEFNVPDPPWGLEESELLKLLSPDQIKKLQASLLA